MSLPRLDKDTQTILKALKTLEGDGTRYARVTACWEGRYRLKVRGTKQCYRYTGAEHYPEFAHDLLWLGLALISAECIEPPFVTENERDFYNRPHMPHAEHAYWYFPLEVIVDGCRVWNERRRRKAAAKKAKKKARR